MKTIGMLGGMSWESTASYYQAVNQGVKAELGGLHSAKICLYSVNFSEIEQFQHAGQWTETARILTDAAQKVEAGGADFLLICTNTMHKVADEIQSGISIPILHIADATAEALLADGCDKVGLLGTGFTMREDFYKQRLQDKYNIQVLTPEASEQELVHNIIYQELCQGIISDDSRQIYLNVIEGLKQKGVQAVILGCTEIALLVQQAHTQVPLYDTTTLHAAKAVELALS